MDTNSGDIAQALSSLVGALSPLISQQSPGPSQTGSSHTPQQSQVAMVTRPAESRSQHQALSLLPSYMRRNPSLGGNRPKKTKPIPVWDKDIVCLPQSRYNYASTTAGISYPRGRYRAQLGSMGLIGKLHLSSDMSEDEVMKEIRSVFKEAMGHNPEFPFVFLQSAGEGCKTLVIPAQSSSYQWTAQQVARLGGQKNTIYILAQADMPTLKDPFDDTEDFSREEAVPPLSGRSSPHSPICSIQFPTSSVSPYSQYIHLVDLTKDEDSDSDSELPIFDLSNRDAISERIDQVLIKHVLKQHQNDVLDSDGEDYQRINVRRSCLLKDSFRQFSKHHFNVTKLLRVVFIGEEAVDEGGPRREFFRLLLSDIFNQSGLFFGYPNNVVPLHNVEALENRKFYTIGKMVATCLVQGGEAPLCFAKAVADFLVFHCPKSPVCIEDIPDYTIQGTFKEISSASTEYQLRSIFGKGDFDFLYMCGYTTPICRLKLKDKDELIRAVWLHYVIYHPHAELEQLRMGICDTLGMGTLVASHPECVWGLLASCASHAFDVTSKYLNNTFIINYSLQGSNHRTQEEAVIYNWFEYISECEGGEDVTLSHILQFLSGSSKVPAAGFSTDPKIYFTSEEDRLPWASTCDVSITFPRSFGLLTVDEFKEKMDLCILGSAGFGTV